MASKNTAKDLLWPADQNILVRLVALYVGQGDSTLALIANGESYRTMLIDINLDAKNGGINVPRLVADLVGSNGLDIFVNTHPHDDHLRGIVELSEAVSIGEVWHSGHVPGRKYQDAYEDLKKVIKKVKDAGGAEVVLKGSKKKQGIGDAEYYVLAPAEYVSEEIEEEDPDVRYHRIHEQCVVLKLGTGDTWIMITGDADRDAFEKHITDYHKERLSAAVLSAAHHGSRSFFKHGEDDEPYLDALQGMGPEYVIMSAPKREESEHGHPHKDAVDLYADEVGEDNVLHTGDKRYSFIVDIYRDGGYGGVNDDKGALAEHYGLSEDRNDGDKGQRNQYTAPAFIGRTRVDDRPMGVC